MDYQYDVVNYDKNIPATIMHLNLSSETRKTELQWHREPELVYVIEGKSECSRNGESKIIEEGDPKAVRVWNAMLYNICKGIGIYWSYIGNG